MASTWQTTVDDLVRTFLRALNDLVPTMQAARVLDDNLIGYDDWARVTDVLFQTLVVEPIRSVLPKEQQSGFDLPHYDTEYESYEDFSFLIVTAGGDDGEVSDLASARIFARFVWLNSDQARFDAIETIGLDADGGMRGDSLATVSVDEGRFVCVVPVDNGLVLYDEIEPKLD